MAIVRNHPAVHLQELLADAHKAFGVGIDYLLANTLQSPWSTLGRGWQQLWASADHAGVYASCDGLLLLSHLNEGDGRFSDAQTMIQLVLHEHLAIIFDRTGKTQTQELESVRKVCLNTTFKLAKFVQATAALRSSHPTVLHGDIRNILIAAGERTNGVWGPGLESAIDQPSVFATAEALLALRDEEGSAITTGREFLQTVADSETPRTTADDAKEDIVAIWALTELGITPTEAIRVKVLTLLQHDVPLARTRADLKFYIRALQRSDYYNFNLRLMLATAVLNMLTKKLLPSDRTLASILPTIVNVVGQLRDRGVYVDPEQGSAVYFWEYYQAMMLVRQFITYVEGHTNSHEVTYMYISPVHFRKTQFTTNSSLAVILMPFGPKWSNDVLEVFETVARKHGYTPWRSDKTWADDIVVQTIWEKINEARFVIADCSDKNPNVFYELGIAHTLGKPVFMCAQKRKDFVFDIAGIRSYQYETLPASLKQLASNLSAFIDGL